MYIYKYIVIAATLCLISWENCQTIKKITFPSARLQSI